MQIKKTKKALKNFLRYCLVLILLLSLTLTSLSGFLLLPIGPTNVNAQSCGGVGGSSGGPGVRPGGVALNQAATFLANMTDYSGAYYDSTLDRIVFIGKTNTQAPKFNKDDLAVAIKSVVFNNTIPYVSLETQAGDTNNSQPMQVVFSTELEDTKFGQIILDADYKMKQYSQGYNEDRSVLVSSVPGYKSFWQRYQENGITQGSHGSRFWITPMLVSLRKDDPSKAFVFDQVKMQIITEPTSSDNSPQWNNAARDFSQQQTDLYDEFAKETPSYLQTKQLSQIVAVVKWIKDAGIVNNFEWAKSHQPEYNATPRTKPRLTTPVVSQGGFDTNLSGGANYLTPNTYTQDTGEAIALKTSSQAQSGNKEDVHWTFTRNGQTYDSVAVEAEAFRSVGAYATSAADFSTPITDDLSLQIARSYSSYSSAQNGIGRGWSLLPVTLTQIYWGWDQITGCTGEGYGYKKVAVTFNNGNRETFEYRYCGGEYTALDPAYNTRFFINSDGSYFARIIDQTEYLFDASLKLTQVKDKNGNKISYTYDGGGKLTQIKDDNNHFLNLGYNSGNLANLVTDWAGRITTYGYDVSGNLTSVTDPKGGVTKYAYDSNNRLISVTNRLNQIVLTNTFNQDGRLATQKDSSGKIVTHSYDNATNTVTTSDNQGRIGKTIFDDKVRVLKQQDATNNAVDYTYGVENLPLTIKDKKGNITTLTYDANGNRTSQKDPAGININFEYDQKNNLTKKTDFRYVSPTNGNKITNLSYDANGNLVQKTEDSKVTKYSYNSKGQLIGLTDPQNKTFSYTRDPFNNILTTTDPQISITTYTYDGLGRLTQVKDPDNKVISFTYDNNNNLLTTVTSLGTTTNQYNAENKLTKITEPSNIVTQLGYNPEQDLTSVTDAMSNLTSYGYDQYKNITTKQDALNRTTQNAYDKLNQLTQSTTPLGKVTTWEYDPNGNINKRIDSNNQTTTYEYDNLNRLKKINYPNATSIFYTYDNRGNLLTMIDPTGTTNYTYDSFDRLISVRDSSNALIQYEYDLSNNLTKITYPDNRSVIYSYDGSGKLLTVIDWNNTQTTYQYNKNGSLSSRTYPNGVKTNYLYDAANNITEVAHLQGAVTLAKFNYTKDNLGNITGVTENNVFSSTIIPPSGSLPAGSTPFVITGFSGQYWNAGTGSNPTIPTTTPNLTRTDNTINFDWGGGSPATAINVDHFVTRWTKTASFPAGNYRFKTTTDDGVRLFIDGVNVIDKWVDQGATTYTSDKTLTAGNHTVVMEYYENGGGANAKLEVEQLSSATTSITGFTGQYWNAGTGTAPAMPTTTPNLTRIDNVVNFDWGGGSPAAGINVDRFIAKWTKTASFPAGSHEFKITGDDGVRLFIDGIKVIDKWIDQGPTTYVYTQNMTVGNHTVVMEYYENGGGAVAKLDITQIATTTPSFAGQYWNVPSSSNFVIPTTAPTLSRTDNTINFDWGGGSPDPVITNDYYMARWTRTSNFVAGLYQFKSKGDDGVRLFIDGVKVLDGWRDQAPTTYSVYKDMTAGNHTIVMEYYERGGGALAKLEINQITLPTNTQTTFGYDALERLLTANYPNNNTNSYTYDKVGNRLSSTKSGQQTTFSYNNDNHLTVQGGVTYTYDNNGNRVTSKLNNVTKTLGYNPENKLLSYQDPATSLNLSFVYDGKGNRVVEKTATVTSMKYVNDLSAGLSRVLQSQNLATNTTTNYVYGVGLISQGTDVFLDRKFFLEDGLGNVRYIMDATSNNIQTFNHDAFGNTINGGTVSKYQYKGEEFDDKTGLYFMRARYYDPETGRFISRDPVSGYLSMPQTQNPYSYAINNPINLSDPSGEAIPVVLAACALAACRDGDCTNEVKAATTLWPAISQSPSVINGIKYTVEAVKRMEPVGFGGRGVPPSVVENAIKYGEKSLGNKPDSIVNTLENVTAITNEALNTVITVIKTGH